MLGDRQKVTVRYGISKFARLFVIMTCHFFAGFDEMLILYYVCYNLFATFNKALTILMYSMKVINLMIMYISIGQYKKLVLYKLHQI